MEQNGLKVSRAKTEHLQTRADSGPVRMKRYMETETVNLPSVQSFKYRGSTIDRRGGASQQRRGEQSDEGTVEMERDNWSELRQESTNENEECCDGQWA